MIEVLWASLLGTIVVLLWALRQSHPAKSATARQWVLVAEAGPLEGGRFELGQSCLLLGRDPESCQLVYAADTVSRRHVQFRPSDQGVEVTNLSATNRTYVNGEPESRAVIRAGDSVRVHDLLLRLVDEGVNRPSQKL